MENKLMPALLMLAISLGSIGIIIWGMKKSLQRTAFNVQQQQRLMAIPYIATGAWLLILAVLAAAGFFKVFTMPPRVVIIVIMPVIGMWIWSFSNKIKILLRAIPPHWILMMQSFRILVEFWLWYAFTKGLIPEQMTFEGRNYDILSGILGLVAGWLIMRKRKGWKTITIIYNIIGLGLLFNIVIVAVLSFPGPLRYFMNEPANRIVTEFPFIYLPGVLVVIAFVLHIVSLRQVAMAEK